MKTMKKLFSVALSIVLAFGVVASVAPTTATADSLLDEYGSMLDTVQQNIEQTYSYEQRAAETASIIQGNQILSSLGDTDWYAGQYIDSEGRLHVRSIVSGDSANEIAQAIQSASILSNDVISSFNNISMTSSPDVVIESATYSMRYLEELMTIIRNNRPDYVHTWGVDEERNCIFVKLAECNEASIQDFKERVIDSPAIVFSQSAGLAVPQASIYAGSVVYPTSSSRVTVTMFAYKNNNFGFVTVGHTLGNTIRASSGGSILGTTSSSNKVRTATADGSWTKLNSGHTGYDGEVKVGSSHSNFAINIGDEYRPIQGMAVSAYLGRTGEVRNGIINSIRCEHTCAYSQINSSWSDITCRDMYVANIGSQGGDSGSPLFSRMLSTSMNIWGSLRSGNGTDGFFCDIHEVVDALGVDCVLG